MAILEDVWKESYLLRSYGHFLSLLQLREMKTILHLYAHTMFA